MSSHLIRSPNVASGGLQGPSIFLAGSIEMGTAELWQPRAAQALLAMGLNVFDPRRDDWDPTWAHDPTPGTPFETQVSWELNHLSLADIVLFRITAGTASIVSMLELGMILESRKPIVIWADPGYMRFGNVVITARRYCKDVFTREDEAMAEVRRLLPLLPIF